MRPGPVTFIGTTFFNPPPSWRPRTPCRASTTTSLNGGGGGAVLPQDAFKQSISGSGDAAFQLEKGEVAAVGAFLRAINALENGRSATADLESNAGAAPLEAAEP